MGYLPYDAQKYSGTVWTCPLADEAPLPHWQYVDRWSAHYSMNNNLYGQRLTDGSFKGNNWSPRKLSEAPSALTILIGDGYLYYNPGAGYYFGSYIIYASGGQSPWPMDAAGQIVSHNNVVNIGCADGHAEMFSGPWGTTALYQRFRRADMP